MRAGKLRHRVTIQEPIEERGEDGGITRTWKDVDTVWGSVQPLTGREIEFGRMFDARMTHKVTIRARAGDEGASVSRLVTANRFIHKNRAFNIANVLDDDERDVTMTVLCIESREGTK